MVVEEMDGRWMGRRDRSPGLTRLAETFDKHFRRKTGASLEGIALGIAGDTSPNVLWRILQFPIYLQPKVWWISLGNNDLSRTEVREAFAIHGGHEDCDH